ncbi:hypothetical protein [Leptolyngbya sp. FACHB-711]|uniref:hypothetical protein n=1 Tax=Leptolyngbya sp. FACHB-711 TaxID=2692813 RepID=UPI0016869EBC|nr:hypothetical protein [Leptolyngbya sp. FACHB-711]MBD2025281.1 hypothetical protein [Leptolyngbya sp. FACHB-711]
MNELQAKIKAIQTELESICADVNKPQSRLVALVELPDIEAPLEPATTEPFANSNQPKRPPAAISGFKPAAQAEFKPEFKPPSPGVSLPHSSLRSQFAPPDRSPVQPPVSQTRVPQTRLQQTGLYETSVHQTQLPKIQSSVQSSVQAGVQSVAGQSHSAQSDSAQNDSVNANRLQQPAQTRLSAPILSAPIKDAQPLIRPALQELKAQAEQINQLSQTQETALRRLQSIAAQIDRERRKSQSNANPGSSEASRPTPRLSLPLEQPISLPYVENPQGQVKLAMRELSLQSAEPMTLQIHVPIEASDTADETAQMLRQRQERRETQYQETQYQETQYQEFPPCRRSRRRLPLLKRLRRWLFANRSHSEINEAVPFMLHETLTLLLGAALTRLLLNLLLEAMPLLVVPVMILLVIPAAIAVHRTTTAPQLGITWGYRLCIILLGLLIGGRL